MGRIAAIADRVRAVLSVPKPITLDLAPLHTFDTAPQPIDRLLTAMRNGVGPVGRDEALSVAAVQRGRNELCSIATLPLRLYRGLEVVDSPLFRQFDLDVPNVVHLSLTIEDLALDRIAWWEVVGTDFDGYPAAVRRIDPCRVELKNPTGNPTDDDSRWVWIAEEPPKSGWRRVPATTMKRFDSPNPGILRANARAIRIALQLDALTEMYANNPALREYFTDADDPSVDPMDEDEIEPFLAEYGAMRQVRPYGWLPSNVKRADVSSPSPKDLTLVELRQQVTIALANGLGVDPEDLGVSTTSRTYQNAVDRKQDKVNRVYAPYMKAITDRLGMGDMTRRGYSPQFDLTDYLKPDPNSQAAYWQALQSMGVTDAAEIRGWAKLSGPPPAAAPVPAAPPAAAGQNALPAGRRFDGRPAHTFNAAEFGAEKPTVDTESRTITGLALPYNTVVSRYGIKLQFDPGSLEYSSPDRMPALKDHADPVGRHTGITMTDAGPMVKLAILDAPEGTRAKEERDLLLYDAAQGVYSGLSVGVDFSLLPEDGDVEVDDEGVYHVVRATWRETSITALPQFDDARVTKVAASLQKGNPVDPCPHCGHRHAANVACATFARQLAAAPPAPPAPTGTITPANAPALPAGPAPAHMQQAATFEQFAAWVAAQQQAAEPTEGPTLVNPRRNAEVREPAPYRFDRYGNLRAGSHDFSSDLLLGWRPGGVGDLAARDRAESFVRDAFERRDLGSVPAHEGEGAQRFAITPSNVSALNYPVNRTDLYVDQLDYQYPMYAATNKGTLDTVTPFIIPKFNSSSGLVADHVTGTEPTPGTFTATSQTITPSAVSGKVEITREAFDQGGNPQMSGLIWRQMVRGWYEALESFVQAQLVAAAASITDILITTAAVDSTLDGLLADAIVPLQYIRGGDRFRTVFTQIDLYKALVKAKDSTGRRLYPSLGAMNAVGQADPRYAWVEAHGKLWVPAWATAATGVVAASSWMFDPDVVCLWASAPQRIDLQWRVAWVDMGIWGYKAFGVTDFTRTREIVYDPV